MWARNENDPAGPLELQPIEECFVAEAGLWHVHVGGEVIRTTDEHPFYVVGKGWVATNELESGDALIGRDGTLTPIEEVYETGEVETVYNFRVAEHHTYYVGSEAWGFDVWAHNACVLPKNRPGMTQPGQQLAKNGIDTKGYSVFGDPQNTTGAVNNAHALAVRDRVNSIFDYVSTSGARNKPKRSHDCDKSVMANSTE